MQDSQEISKATNFHTHYYSSPIGIFELISTDSHLISLNFCESPKDNATKLPDCLKNCITQLDEYFKGERIAFDLPLDPQGTEFQKRVWMNLIKVSYAKTASYGELAKMANSPKGFRAVGMANNKNPIALIIPCHRIIGADGSMTGYAGGIWRKEWLLEHEKKHVLRKSA